MIKIDDDHINNILLKWSSFGYFKCNNEKQSTNQLHQFENNCPKINICGNFNKCPYPHRAPIYFSTIDKKFNKKTAKKIIEIRNGLKIKRKNPRVEKTEYPAYNPNLKIEEFLKNYRVQISYTQLKNYDTLPKSQSLCKLQEISSSELKNSQSNIDCSHSNLKEIEHRLNSACLKYNKNFKKSSKNFKKSFKPVKYRKKEKKTKIKYSISVQNLETLLNKKNLNSNVILNEYSNKLETKYLEGNENMKKKERTKDMLIDRQKLPTSSIKRLSPVIAEEMKFPLIVLPLDKSLTKNDSKECKRKSKIIENKPKINSDKIKENEEKSKIREIPKKKIENSNLSVTKTNTKRNTFERKSSKNSFFETIGSSKRENLELLKKKFEEMTSNNNNIYNNFGQTNFKNNLPPKIAIKEENAYKKNQFYPIDRFKEPLIKSIQTSPRQGVRNANPYIKNDDLNKKPKPTTLNAATTPTPRKEIDDIVAKSEYLRFLGIGQLK